MTVTGNSILYTDSNGQSLASPIEISTGGPQGRVQVAAKFGSAKKDESQDEDGESNGQDHTPQKQVPKRKSWRKNDSIWALVSQWIVEHQIGMKRAPRLLNSILLMSVGLAVNLLLLLAMTHLCFPRARRQTRKFFQLSYYNHSSGKYTLGQDDIFIASYWIVVLTGLRAAVMDYALMPLAKAAGIEKKKDRVRFVEQAWIFIYGAVFFSLGMVRFLTVH